MSSADYRVLARYRRTVAAIPSMKRLVAVNNLAHQPIDFGIEQGQLCPDVVFYTLEDQTGLRYWAKRWLDKREHLLGPTRNIESFLATLHRTDLCLTVHISATFGLVYRFDDELFASRAVVHRWDAQQYFGSRDRQAIENLGSCRVSWPGLPVVPVGTLTDFQVTRTCRGLIFLDFEPSRFFAARLAGVRIP